MKLSEKLSSVNLGEVTSGDEALRADLEEVTCAFHGIVLCQ